MDDLTDSEAEEIRAALRGWPTRPRLVIPPKEMIYPITRAPLLLILDEYGDQVLIDVNAIRIVTSGQPVGASPVTPWADGTSTPYTVIGLHPGNKEDIAEVRTPLTLAALVALFAQHGIVVIDGTKVSND